MRAWLHRAEQQDFYNALPDAGPQRLVFLFAFCICIFNVTRHNWLDLENPQEAILYLFELKNLPLLCRLFFPLASNAYFLPEDTLMCI